MIGQIDIFLWIIFCLSLIHIFIQCLGTTPAEFFTDEEPEQIVFEKDDYVEKISEDGNKMIEWIIPNAQKNSMEPVRLTLKPGGSSDRCV